MQPSLEISLVKIAPSYINYKHYKKPYTKESIPFTSSLQDISSKYLHSRRLGTSS